MLPKVLVGMLTNPTTTKFADHARCLTQKFTTMKTQPSLVPALPRIKVAALLGLVALLTFAMTPAHAAVRWWDGGSANNAGNGDGVGAGGSGTWNTTTTNWDRGNALTYTNWVNSANDVAEWTTATASITLGANITVGGINQKAGGSAGQNAIGEGAGPYALTLGITGNNPFAIFTGATGRALDINAAIAGVSGNNLLLSGGTLNLSRTNTFAGNISINNNSGANPIASLNITGAGQLGSGSYLGNIAIVSQCFFTYNSSAAQTFGGVISGAGTLTKNGAGILTITNNANTLNGPTTISGGILEVTANKSLGSGLININNATLSNSVSSTLTNNVNLNNANAAISVGAAQTLTLGGIITNAGAMNKNGAGTLTLTNAGTYTGNTAVNAGTLKLDFNGTIAVTTNITLASGATLDVSTPLTALTLGNSQILRVSATGANAGATNLVAAGKSLTLGNTATNGLEFTAFGGGSIAPLTLAGAAGNLDLNSKPIKLTTTAALAQGPYTLVGTNGAGAAVSGTPGALITAGSGLAANATGTLSINAGRLILTLSYPVTYDGNTSDGGSAPATQNGNYNTSVTAAANTFTKTGYAFAGWNTAANGSGTAVAAGGSYTVTNVTTLYAQWTINNYSVTYDGNTSDGGSAPATQNGNYNTSITAAANTFTKTSFAFLQWNTAANGSGTVVAAGASYTIPASNSTLYAQWTPVVIPTKLVITTVPGSATPAGNTFTVIVQAQDSGGNPGQVSQDTGVSLAASGSGTLAGNTATITTGASSVVLAGVTYTKAEAITLTAAATSGDALSDSVPSSSFTIRPNVANAANSSAVASPASVSADNSAASTVTVTLQDAYNNLLGTGTNVSWSVAGTGNTVSPASSGTTSGNSVSFTVKSVKAETKTVTVTVGATVITNLLQIVFTTPGTGNIFVWDPLLNTVGSDGVGTWNTSTASWASGSADFAWPNNGNDAAVFGTNAALAANRAITLGAPITVGNLTFNTTGANQYTLGNQQTITLAGTPNISVARAATISGILAGTGFSKTGAGTLTLGGANTFSGATTVSSGTLAFTNLAPFDNTSGITLADTTTLRPDVDGATIIAPITISSGAAIINASTINTGAGINSLLNLNGSIGGAGEVTFNSSVANNNLATVRLNAPGTYAGGTKLDTSGSTASQIVVRLGTNDALPATTIVNIDGQTGAGTGRFADLNLNGFNQQLAGLSNTVRSLRTQRVVNSDVVATATLTISNTSDCIYSGTLGGSPNASVSVTAMPGSTTGNNFSLVKNGVGTFTLATNNSFTGGASVLGGTLLVNGNFASATTVASGATLGGSGTFSTNVTLAAGAFATNNQGSPLTVAGSLTLNGNTLNVATPSALAVGNYLLLTNTSGGISGAFAAVNISGAGLAANTTGNLLTTTNTVVLLVTLNTQPTTTLLTSSDNPSGYGQGVTFTAAVQTNGVTAAAATGLVVFKVAGAPVATNALASGVATYGSISNLPRGTNQITAAYLGDGNYFGSTNALSQVVTNHPPVAGNVTYTRNAGIPQLNIIISQLLTNVTDVDSDSISLLAVSPSTNGITLVTNAMVIGYSNTNAVVDQFTYTVSDGYGGIGTGTITLALNTNSVFGQTSPSISTTGGAPTISFAGIPGLSYSVLRSTNVTFVPFDLIWTTNAPAGGLFNYTDNSAPTPAAFYRLQFNP